MNKNLIKAISRFPTLKIAVIGDFMLDEFAFGEISRVSREAPVLILSYRDSRFCPGGAANTVANTAALGTMVYPVGFVGDDYQSEQLLSLWNSKVATNFVIRDKSQKITRKTRILAGSFHSFQQQVVRMDYESLVSMDDHLEKRLAQNIRSAAAQSNALIISDYSLGTLTPRIITDSIKAAVDHGIPLIVDSRDNPHIYRGATTATPNISEVEKTLGKRLGIQDEVLDQYGPRLRKDWGVEALLVTRGKLGMSLFTESGIHHYPPYGMDEAVDVTGAGDTVASIYATSIASGLDFKDSALLANIAGGIVVTKKGTATVSTEELMNAVEGIG